MIEEIITRVFDFVEAKEFWWWHGWGLTFNWLVLAFIGIMVRRLKENTLTEWIHIIILAFVDYTSMFLMVGAAYKLYGSIGTFFLWPVVLQLHVGAGIVVCLWTVVQHTMGIFLHHKRMF